MSLHRLPAFLTALGLLALSVPACHSAQTSNQANAMNRQDETSDQDKPLRKLNPSPKRGYVITMTIDDAPGPFAVIDGAAQYDVTNDAACGDYNIMTGNGMRITSNESFELKQVSSTEFQGLIYLDMIRDDDYYGRGVCHWEFTEARAILKATDAVADTAFIPNISAKSILSQGSEKKYFLKKHYPKAGMDDYPDSGQADRSKIASSIPDSGLFTITMSAKEAQP